jgi:hypothetical protein
MGERTKATHTHIQSLSLTDGQTGSRAARRIMVFPVGCVIGFNALSPYQKCLGANVTLC